MANRRNFIKTVAVGTVGLALNSFKSNDDEPITSTKKVNTRAEDELNKAKPIVISTWNFGVQANGAAWQILKNKGRALDAVEAGVKIPEGDPNERSVGYGGRPDRDGRVTLDSCIMDEFTNIGSEIERFSFGVRKESRVARAQGGLHPPSAAPLLPSRRDDRLCYETPHGHRDEGLLRHPRPRGGPLRLGLYAGADEAEARVLH